MNIVTQHVYPPIPIRTQDWCAYDSDTYDGADDSHPIVGWGSTEAEALADFRELQMEHEADAQAVKTECSKGAVLAAIALLAFTGCSAIRPDTLRIEAEHTSHLTQHFGSDPTNFGYNDLALELHWQRGLWFADVSEGVILNRRDIQLAGVDSYGGMMGPREIFQARTGVEISLR